MLASQTDKNRESFTTTVEVPEYDSETGIGTMEWVNYSATLPAGTRYFAIQSTSDDQQGTWLTEIEFCGYNNDYALLEIEGFNVYRNGTLVATLEPEAETYTFTDLTEDDVVVMTILYNNGESWLSNALTGISGLESIDSAPLSGVVNVYNISGVLVGTVDVRELQTLPRGIYIATNGNGARKVVVR